MNTLEELNGYGTTGLIHNDERPFTVDVTLNSATFATVINEEETYTPATDTGITINEMYSASGSGMFLEFDLSNLTGNPQISWTTIDDVSYTEPSPGVHRCEGIYYQYQFDAIKSPTVTFDDDTQFSSTAVSCRIYDTVNAIETSWTENLTVNNLSEITPTSLTNFVYDEDVPLTLPTAPTLVDIDHTNCELSLTLSDPNAGTLSASGSGVHDFTNGVLTITGTAAEINTNVDNLYFEPAPDYELDFTITYLWSKDSGVTTLLIQDGDIGDTHLELATGPIEDHSYDEDGSNITVMSTTPAGQYEIQDEQVGATFTVEVTLSDAAAGVLSSTGGSWSSPTLTLTGDKATVNSQLAAMEFNPALNYELDFTINYRYEKDGAPNVSLFDQNINNNWAISVVVTTDYSYFVNKESSPVVFTITDPDPDSNSYTLELQTQSSNLGTFEVDGTPTGSAGYVSVSGSKATLEAYDIRWIPDTDYETTVNIDFTMTKNTGVGDKVINESVLTLEPVKMFQTINLIGGGDSVNNDFETWWIAEYGSVAGLNEVLVFEVLDGTDEVDVDSVSPTYGPTPAVELGHSTAGWPHASWVSTTLTDLSGSFTQEALLDTALAPHGGRSNKIMVDTNNFTYDKSYFYIVFSMAWMEGSNGGFTYYPPKQVKYQYTKTVDTGTDSTNTTPSFVFDPDYDAY